MEIEITKQSDAPLLSRKRVTALTVAEGKTPSRLTVQKALAKQLKVAPECLVIKHLYPQFGDRKVKIIANMYETPEILAKFEHKSLVAKHQEKADGKDKEAAKAE